LKILSQLTTDNGRLTLPNHKHSNEMEKQQQKETRLDRIEKSLELFFKGMSELRDSQKKTDEQILELKDSQKKTDEQIRNTDEQILELKESLDKTIERLDRIGRQLADLGLVQGEVAEDLFYRNIQYLFKDRNIAFSSIKRNLKKKGTAEYDIVAVNSNVVLVVEVKNKLQKRMIDSFINKRIPNFKKVFPQYNNYKLLGGIGALVVKDEVGRYAEKSGLYVLTQTSDGGASLINRKGFQAKDFS